MLFLVGAGRAVYLLLSIINETAATTDFKEV